MTRAALVIVSTVAMTGLNSVGRSVRGQTADPAQSQERKTTVSQRGRILGIGGIFFKSANQQEMKEWYAAHLGLADSGHGVMLPWRERDNPQNEQTTVWSIFPGTTRYFEP